MPDNVDITPGTGKTVAADEVGGALHQRVKLSVGADGEAADLDHGQSAMAASLPVVIASDQTDVPITLDGETVPVTDNGGSLTVDGPLTDTELRATDVPVTLDGEAVVLGAGSEAIGKLAANSGVDIGDVDVTSVVPGTAATSLGKAEDAAHTTGDTGVMALGVRQDTIAPLAADGDYLPPTMDANGQLRTLAGFPDVVVTVTPTLDTNAYADGDLLFDSTEIANAVRVNGGTCILQNVTILDKSDQGVAMTLLFANAETDFGTLNAAPDPDDTESGTVLCWMPVEDTDYLDLGANKVACIGNLGLLMQAGAATTSIYIAAINGSGTPTYANGDLVLKLSFMRA